MEDDEDSSEALRAKLETAAEYGRLLLKENQARQDENAQLKRTIKARAASQQPSALLSEEESTQLQRRVAEMEDTVVAAAEERKQLQQLLDQREAELDATTETANVELRQQLASALTDAARQSERAERLEAELAELADLHEQQGLRVSALSAHIEADGLRLSDLTSERRRTAEDAARVDVVRKELKQENAQLKDRLREVTGALAAARAQLGARDEQEEASAAIQVQLRAELLQVQSTNASLQAKVEALGRMVDSIGSLAQGVGDGKEVGEVRTC